MESGDRGNRCHSCLIFLFAFSHTAGAAAVVDSGGGTERWPPCDHIILFGADLAEREK